MQQRQRRHPNHADTPASPIPEVHVSPSVRPGVMRATDVRALQQAAGNRATRRAVQGEVQRSVEVGAADHPSEVEADRVARDVVSSLGDTAQRQAEEEEPLQLKRDESVQRSSLEEEELQLKRDDTVQRMNLDEEEPLQAKHDESVQRMGIEDESSGSEEEELQLKRDDTVQRMAPEEDELLQGKRDDTVQRDAAGPEVGREGGSASAETGGAIHRARGGGQRIPDGVRGSLEQAFGADFGGVRVHNDAESLDLNQRVGAKAFTTGSDIFFGKSGFNPSSSAGKELLAHELTHVVQQGAARSLDADAHHEGDGHRH